MTLADLVQEVYNITGRPDRVAETLSAIKAATLKAHQSDFYWKDLFEAGLDLGVEAFVQNFDYRSVVPRWRALKYLRKFDTTTGVPGTELDVIVPEQVFDAYKVQKQDVCYSAGAYIQINSSTAQRYYILGCYINPDITDSGFSSWIAVDHPYAIVYDAAATVFKAIGKDEETSAYRTLVAEQIAMLKMSNVEGVGY